uniref:Uncharacterized protein n=1 Tax=Anguilla anguilla TaxID=7936 RepID=A0A0E9R5C6_ANGAN
MHLKYLISLTIAPKNKEFFFPPVFDTKDSIFWLAQGVL